MESPTMKLDRLFDEVANKMRADFNHTAEAIGHAGLKGANREKIVSQFIRDYLPQSLDVSTGQVVDADGNLSRQLDIIISDAARTPIFYRSGDTRVVPIEGVYAVIEVKSHLDAKQLGRAFTNMRSVRKLRKTAYFKPPGPFVRVPTLYGQEYEVWPVNYFIFAFGSIGIAELLRRVAEVHIAQSLPPHCRIDCVCVLDKGVICNRLSDGTIDALPDDTSSLVAVESPRALLLFYALISRFLFQVEPPLFRFKDYLRNIKV
ncbi:MAG: hypothetical protein HY691_12955 [Chloroflexi bacterium]|nr:hypothetical protein [Chloroflexota bacterium]